MVLLARPSSMSDDSRAHMQPIDAQERLGATFGGAFVLVGSGCRHGGGGGGSAAALFVACGLARYRPLSASDLYSRGYSNNRHAFLPNVLN